MWQQVAQRLDRGPGLRQFGLEPSEMRGDEGVAGRGVGRVEDRLDLADRHLQIPQAANHLRGRYLRGAVVAVARAGVHCGRFQQADLTNYFTVRDGKIVSLIVIRNTPPAY